MTDNKLADLAKSCWEYAKSVGAVSNPNFEKWFKNRARTLHQLNETEVSQVWRAAITMYS
tara:strand:+ start:56 stop:235 length:180 start_codon:yes stop_codon:yes gene_type:complete